MHENHHHSHLHGFEFDGILLNSLFETLHIVGYVFLLMILIEFLVIRFRSQLIKLASKNKFLAYTISSVFGSFPGCLGTFAMDSLYMSGFLGFGGIVAVMITTMGDEAFILFHMIGRGEVPMSTALFLMGGLLLAGIVGGATADWSARIFKVKFVDPCEIENHDHEVEFKFGHFFKEHVFNHIIKKHIWQIFLWVFVAVICIEFFQDNLEPQQLKEQLGIYMILMAGLFGILPTMGWSLVLFPLYIQGHIPFSVILTLSIVHDGHGLLPILGFSLKDALKIKFFNLVFGILLGGLVYLFGF